MGGLKLTLADGSTSGGHQSTVAPLQPSFSRHCYESNQI